MTSSARRAYQKFIAEKNFSLRLDFDKRRDKTEGGRKIFNPDEFKQRTREIDFKTNVAFLGNKNFRYIRKHKAEEERIYGLIAVEGRNLDKDDIHFHSLIHIPSTLTSKQTEIENFLKEIYEAQGYSLVTSPVQDLVGSTIYNLKEQKIEGDEEDGAEFLYFSHQDI